jgi:hypothetical protein
LARYHGKSGLVYISTTGTGAAASVGKLSAWTLDMPTDKVETTAFDDTNKTYVQGLKDVAGTLTGFWDDTVDTLFTAGDSADGCKIYLYPASTAITKYWYGPAWLDASIASGVSAAVTVAANFSANGAWGRK